MIDRRIFRLMLLVAFCCYAWVSEGQDVSFPSSDKKYFQLKPGSIGSNLYSVELFSDIDTSWEKWKLRGYSFGFDPDKTPMYTSVNGILSTPYMIQVRGNENETNKKRWGFHIFEGYANDDKSRLTMLVNKHVEMNKPVAEIYYYGTAYNHSTTAYNWIRIGSDVKNHSYMFSRDKAVFYGSLKLKNAFTLGNIGAENLRMDKPEGDDESNAKESAKHVNFIELKNSTDGTIFYDSDNHMVVIKIQGKWMKLKVEELPEGIDYEFAEDQ
ncbi:hypothetical protein KUV50_13585 [Membranicola marinus]|uniref:Uncharacterized protein n=1 Tax=Membranihabitans marinus TaxID=1227546 RepID=A0A953HQ45_9BACT|nr:hypothetical protein [Membranihabitans marinus]MBY5959179.1 hypothetical protein [Membranihabitans marinus]